MREAWPQIGSSSSHVKRPFPASESRKVENLKSRLQKTSGCSYIYRRRRQPSG